MTLKNPSLEKYQGINPLLRFFTIGAIAIGLFAAASGAQAAVPYVVSTKITGPNTVSVVFSEAVYTNLSVFSNFSGALSGRNLIYLIGSGTNTILLFFDGSSFSPSAIGYLTVGSGTMSIGDNSPSPGGMFYITDGRQFPTLSSVTVSSNNVNNAFAKIGNMITLTFSTNVAVLSPTVTIAGHTITASGSGAGPYTAAYVISGGDTEGTILATISFSDTSGNSGGATVTVSSGSAASQISSITSNANSPGVLKIGDSVTFTLTPATIQPNARVSGYYNGVPLSWYTSNSGATYAAVYTVVSGHNDQISPLQISGVTLTDQYGSVSAPVSGSGVMKTIDAHAPVISEATPMPSTIANANPSYGFFSSEAGIIHYVGDCYSQTASAYSVGVNTVIFNNLANGYHSNCSITVMDASGNTSNQLTISPFTVQGAASTPAPTPTPAPAFTPTPTPVGNAGTSHKFYNPLTVGSRGTDVTELQKRLTIEGVYSGPITGYFGPLTQAAVRRYQAAHDVAQLGNVGPSTRASLNSE